MNNTTIRVPTESLPSIIHLLTDEITRLNDRLKDMTENISTAKYRISELSNQVESLKDENKRLWAMYQNKEDF